MFVVILAMLALILPIASVIFAVRQATKPAVAEATKPAAVVAEATVPLQKALEDAAQKTIAPETLSLENRRLVLEVTDLGRENARITELVKKFGGVALPDAPTATEVRLLIQMPESRAEPFLKACQGLEAGEASPVAGDDQASALLEVLLKKKNP